jgi:hypothetical protein
VCSVDVPISRTALAAGSPWARELSRGARARKAGQSGAESELASTMCLGCISPASIPVTHITEIYNASKVRVPHNRKCDVTAIGSNGGRVCEHFTSDNQVSERRRLDVLRPLPGAVPHLVFSQLLGAFLTHFVRVWFQALFRQINRSIREVRYKFGCLNRWNYIVNSNSVLKLAFTLIGS